MNCFRAIPFLLAIVILPFANGQHLDSLRAFLDSNAPVDSIQFREVYFQSLTGKNNLELAETYVIWAEYLQNQYYQYDSAKGLAMKAISLYEKEGDKRGLAEAKSVLVDSYRNADNRAESIRLGHEVHKLFLSLGDSMKIYRSLADIAIDHDYLGHHDLAIRYYNECVEICRSIGYVRGVAAMYHNLAGIYSYEGDNELALKYHDKSTKLYEEEGEIDWISYQGLYLTYMRMELFGEALKNLKKEVQLAKLSKDPRAMPFAYQDYSFYHSKTGNYDSSIYYAQKALKSARQLNIAQVINNAYYYLRIAHYELSDYKSAYDFYELEVAMNDSVYNMENTRLIESIKTEFETEKNERELAEKNLALQTASFELKKKSNLQTFLIVGLLLLFIVLFLIYRGYRQRQKANELLMAKNEQIESHSRQIEAINETKSRWFINVAHELRTPLTLIKGPIQRMLTEKSLSPDVEEDLQLVHRNTKSLVKLVNEILDLSKLEEGEMALDMKVVNINDLVRQVMSIFEVKAAKQEVALLWTDVPEPYVELDRDKITKVLVNLISNALRFTPVGGKITISYEIKDALEIAVSDTGAGIAEDDQPYIFDRFYQAEGTRNAGGTGVGLALAKEIAELHGGKMLLKSEPGTGSTFTIELPSDLYSDRAEATELPEVEAVLEDNFMSTSVLSRLSEKPHLLIVEDHEDMRNYVANLLKPYFEVVTATNGKEGLQVLESHDIKMIISDMMMPEMDGRSFSKAVKSKEDWKTIPFIHLSALTEDDVRKEALRIGVDDYLQKPFDPEELIIRVQNLYQNAISRMEIGGADQDDEEISHEDKLLRKLRDEVLGNISDSNFNVLRLADCAAMSERQIYRYLKNATGLTPLQFIQEIKLNRAMELAQKKVYMSSGELASAVGFQQSPYFSSLFEKRFGKKPSAYLKAG